MADIWRLTSLPRPSRKDPGRDKVRWHGDSEFRVARYRFNTKQKDQMFCPRCGASLGIDFRDVYKPDFDGFGISVGGFFFAAFLPPPPTPNKPASVFSRETRGRRSGSGGGGGGGGGFFFVEVGLSLTPLSLGPYF